MNDELTTLKSELRERTDLLFSYALQARGLEAQLAELKAEPVYVCEECDNERLIELKEQLAAAQAQVAAVTEQRDAAIEAVMGEDYVFGQYEIEDTPTLHEIISNQVEVEKAYARVELQDDIAKWKELFSNEMERNLNNVANAQLQIETLTSEYQTWREACGKARERADAAQAEVQAMVGRLTTLAEEWAADNTWSEQVDGTLKHCAGRLREAISGEGEK